MDAETIYAKIDAQVSDALKIAGPFKWQIQKDGFTVFVAMCHRRKSDHIFLLRVSFDDYPQRAPSYVFVNGDRQTPGGWPPKVKHGSNPPGICTPGTRECIEHYHRGDAKYQWDPNMYTFRFVLMGIQTMLEKGLGG